MNLVSRRAALQALLTLGASASLPRALAAGNPEEGPAPAMAQLIAHPLLVESLYRRKVSDRYAADGRAGGNLAGYRWIEEQRQGAEWIVRGAATATPGWLALGWQQLDWGLAQQQGDGGFASEDAFHSTALFVEALARACLLDPDNASRTRLRGLGRGADWLMQAEVRRAGARGNQPFTHRRYILAAALGQSAVATGETGLARAAEDWAREGLARQAPDGTNPERGGYDVGYQMVGVLMALRYLPVCEKPALRGALRAMIRRAVALELTHQAADGSLDAAGSTRVGREAARDGRLKEVPYAEILQALVWGAQALPEPAWLGPARNIARLRHWLPG